MFTPVILAAPLLAVGMIVIPFVRAVRQQNSGVQVNHRRVILRNAGTFICCMIAFAIGAPLLISASPAETAGAVVANGFSEGMRYLSAALTTGAATVATGIAVSAAAPSAIGATSEDPKNFSKALIFVALGEGVAIYGMLISILILFS